MVPSQMPTNFKIFPLPPELVSTVGKWLRLQPKMEQLQETPTRSAMSTGANGKTFLQQLNLPTPAFRPPLPNAPPLLLCASAIRESGPELQSLPGPARDAVQEGSVRAALDTLASTYRANELPSPIHDNAGCLNYLLGRQPKGFKHSDPSSTPQKAVSPRVIRAIAAATDTPLDRTIGQLVVGAFFFAMRSCEYSSVYGERRTKLLKLRNICFYKNNRELAAASPFLHLADCVSITFFFQKHEQCDETVTMHCTEDPTLCPVRSWAAVCSRIRAYPGATPSTPVNTYIYPVTQKLLCVTSKQVLTSIRAVVTCIGKDELGYSGTNVGTHSLRSAAAMAMYLAGVSVFAIMLRRQVQEFSSGVSSRMLVTAA